MRRRGQELRETFDASPEVYDRTRPVPPAALFDDLVRLAGFGRGADVVEIGCGTGQASVPLAQRGVRVVAVELGERLAEFAARKLAAYPGAEVVCSSFEAWEPGDRRFDGVVAVNAIHWVDPAVRYAKPARVLRADGVLALVASRYVTPENAHSFWVDVQDDYTRVVGPREDNRPPPRPDEVRDLREDMEASGHFRHAAVRRYVWTHTFTADDYVALLSTSSWHRALPERVRQELFSRIAARIAALPERTVTATLVATLNVARRL